MICSIKQIRTSFNMTWTVSNGNYTLCEIASPFETSQYNVMFRFTNGKLYRLYYNPFDKTYGKKLADRLSFKVFDFKDELIGSFVGQTHKTGRFFGGYTYFALSFDNVQYIGYEVGRAREGISLCLYKEDEIIGIIDKNPKVINFQDEYNIYLSEEKYLEIATLFSVYYDALKFNNVGEIKLYSELDTYLITTNKELMSKYDPDFIPRIKAMDGIYDQ